MTKCGPSRTVLTWAWLKPQVTQVIRERDTFICLLAACNCRARCQTSISLAEAKMHLLGIHPFKSLVGLLPHHELIFDRPGGKKLVGPLPLGSMWLGRIVGHWQTASTSLPLPIPRLRCQLNALPFPFCQANIRHIEDPTDPAAVPSPKQLIHPSPVRAPRSVVATRLRSPVHGVVHAISQKELTALDSSEAPLYHRVQMPLAWTVALGESFESL